MFLLFEVWKEKSNFFGTSWKPHRLTLLKREEIDLWEVEVKSHDNEKRGDDPEEIFLLQSVEQIITGTDLRLEKLEKQ